MDGAKLYLGRYHCVERIGQGALGETFRAKIYGVAGFEKQFAVKRLHARLCADEAFITRFVQAANRAAALLHERIVAIHEVGVEGRQYYLAADLVRGCDLGQLIEDARARGQTLDTDAAISVALDVIDGLGYAHRRVDLQPAGVPHLGLTPRSVMVTRMGDAKLLDVGLLAALAGPGWADDDALVPTLAYLAPEVIDAGAR
jgi:serine/threonine protein kinase